MWEKGEKVGIWENAGLNRIILWPCGFIIWLILRDVAFNKHGVRVGNVTV